ncbi:MAG: phage regulatory CII family protein, partial [Pseudomonadota bacterium]|nr:phage regulatory CII family protein [Pseudomonadota bacterium]
MNIELSQEARTAIWAMVHKSGALKPIDIAQMLDDPHKAVLNNANANMPNHVFTLAKIEAIMQYTENPALLKVWAHKLGYVLVKADDVE